MAAIHGDMDTFVKLSNNAQPLKIETLMSVTGASKHWKHSTIASLDWSLQCMFLFAGDPGLHLPIRVAGPMTPCFSGGPVRFLVKYALNERSARV